MNFSIMFIVVVFAGLSLFQDTIVGADPFCGNMSTNISCHKGCYKSCMVRLNNEDLTNETVKESIATQTNLCVNNCFGNSFLPLAYEDVPKLPHYLDALGCLGRCAHPVHPKYCLEGYLSSFFYCECHQCCLQNTDNEKCVRGCHIWFVRQWSPKPREGCRYRAEMEKSPRTWCTDFCVYMALRRNASLSWNDVPSIKTSKAAQCLRGCVSLVLSGAPVDFDMDFVPCTQLSKCVTVTAFKFKVFSNIALTSAYFISKIRSDVPLVILPPHWSNTRSSVLVEPTIFYGEKYVPGEFDIKRDYYLDRIRNSGIVVRSEWGAENNTFIQTQVLPVPWRGYGEALAKAYNYSANANHILGRGYIFISDRDFEFEPCTQITFRSAVKMVHGLRLEHEVEVKVADTVSLFPMTALQLQSAVAQRTEWSGLEFVRNLDEHTLVYRGKGSAIVRFGYYHVDDDLCEPIQGCNHPRNASATKFCRVITDRSHTTGVF